MELKFTCDEKEPGLISDVKIEHKEMNTDSIALAIFILAKHYFGNLEAVQTIVNRLQAHSEKVKNDSNS